MQDKILQLPAIVKRMEDRHLTEIDESFQNVLLSTIRVPKNLHFLTERLPKANYAPLKVHKVDKYKFLQTLAGYKERKPYDDRLDVYKDEGENNSHLPPIKNSHHPKDSINRPLKDDISMRPLKDKKVIKMGPELEDYKQKDNDLLSIKKVIEARKQKEKELRELKLLESQKQKEQIRQNKEQPKELPPILNTPENEAKDTEKHLKEVTRLSPDLKDSLSIKKLQKESPEPNKMEVLNSYKVQHQHQNHHAEKIPKPEVSIKAGRGTEKENSPSQGPEKKYPGYSVHDLNKDVVFDKHLIQIQNIYGVRPNKKIGVDMVPRKPLEAKKIVKKEEYDVYNYRNIKLPSLNNQPSEARLPPLKNDTQPTPSMSKEKIKELSKVYKVRLGPIENPSDKHQNILRSNSKKDKVIKNQLINSGSEYLDNHLIRKKSISQMDTPEVEV